jgi:chromate transporter
MDTGTQASNTRSDPNLRPSLLTIFKVFVSAGGLSFGGGAVAYLREYIVKQQGWLDDEGFLGAMEISETVPGLIAVNMSVIVGDNLRGIPGAMVAVLGMLLPGSISVMTLAILYQSSHTNPDVKHFLLGIAAAAVGLLTMVAVQLGRRQFGKLPDAVIVAVTFFAVSILKVNLPLVLVTLGPFSVWLYRPSAAPERQPGEHLPFHRGPRHHLFHR